jgi:hypothetical protein
MNALKQFINDLVDLLYTAKDKKLSWLTSNQEQQLKLSHDRILAKNELTATLTKNNVQLAHEIELLKIRQASELAMLKSRSQEDIKDYQHYLTALALLKKDIQSNFAHLPEAMALTLHHHSKTLLNNMWEATDFEEKLRLENQLIQFMSTAYEDGALLRSGKQTNGVPENTLRLLNQHAQNKFTH